MPRLSKRPYAREDESLDQYLQEIGEVALLTADQEVVLAKRIKKGDQGALEGVDHSQPEICSKCRQTISESGAFSMGDLINEGNLGLIKAAKRFDETKGFKFISYAVWWIRQAILQALAEQSRIVRLPLNRVGALPQNWQGFEWSRTGSMVREPSPGEIADELGMNDFEVRDTLKISSRHLSLDAPFKDGEDNNLLDVIEDGMQPPSRRSTSR